MENKKEDRSSSFFIKGLSILWDLLGDEKGRIIKLVFVILCVEVVFLMIPYTLNLVVNALPNVIKHGYDKQFILLLVMATLAPVFALILNHFFKNPIFFKSIIRLENWWPVVVQQKMLALHQGYHEKENTGKKVTKINKGCDKMIELLGNILDGILPNVFYLLINFVIMLTLSPVLALIFFAPFIPMAVLVKRIYDKRVPSWNEWSSKNETSNGFLCQSIINVATVQGFIQEETEKRRMEEVRGSMEKIDLGIHLSMQKEMFFVGFVLRGAFSTALLTGIWFVSLSEVNIGTLVYLIATGGISMGSLQNIVRIYSKMMQDIVEVYRMKDLLSANIDVQNNNLDAKTGILSEYRGEFIFNNVSFYYSKKSRLILESFDMGISQGQMTAIIGKSGEGKSTVVRLLARVYDVSDGSITLDGRDIRTLDRNWYRGLFATVQQDVDIFDLSLRENIAYACPDASEDQILKAVNAAHLVSVLKKTGRFPDGLNTQVGERGVRLSGGERQRVGIARAYLALLNGAKVLILDEATSSLDSEAEKAIQEMIGKLRQEMSISIVAIAHRLSTIEMADKICVVDRGSIIEEGDHKRLVAHNGLYAKLVKLQQLGELRS